MTTKPALLVTVLMLLALLAPASGLAQDYHDTLGFYAPPPDCLQCHSALLSENHPAGCWTCHDTGYRLKLCPPSGSLPGLDLTTICANYQTETKEPFSCGDCHTTPSDHAAAHCWVFLPSEDCTLCHVTDAPAEHARHNLNCSTCHSSLEAAVKDAIARGKAGSSIYCADCHGLIDHQTHRNAYEPCADCSGCHPTYDGLGADIVNGHSKKGVACAACHTSTDPTIEAAIAKGVAGNAVYCNDCHARFGNHAQVHDQTCLTSEECGACHVANAVAEHQGHGPHSIGCLPCHTNPSARVAAAIYNGMAGRAVACGDCHDLNGNRAPIANAGPDRNATKNLTAQFSGSASHDHDGTIVGYQWNFGDGTPAASGAVVSHIFTAAGTYPVGLTVTDDQGAANTDTCTVTVLPPAVRVEAVWTTDLADAPKTSFSRGQAIRYHVRFTTEGGPFFTKAKVIARNTSGTYWLRSYVQKQTLAEGTYHWHWDAKVPFEAAQGSTAKVKIKVKILDRPLGTLLCVSQMAAVFNVQ